MPQSIESRGNHPIWVDYELCPAAGEDPGEMARAIGLEQTVELDLGLIGDEDIRRNVVGQVAEIEALGANRYRARLIYDQQLAGAEVPQLLNLLFGNISLKRGIRLADCDLALDWLPGPRHGIAGIRRACGVEQLPLLSTALKPMGSTSQTFADMAYDLAVGGLNLLKDDHGLANQTFSPFAERVRAVAGAIARAHRDSGHRCLYFPHFAPKIENLDRALALCQEVGVDGLLVCPGLVGLDMLRYLREHTPFMLMVHPAWTGSFFNGMEGGVRPGFYLGKLCRAMGADASIFPNVGGRFLFDLNTCHDINRELRHQETGFKAAFPVPAGGMSLERIPEMRGAYGDDLIFLIGGGLFRMNPDLKLAMASFREALQRPPQVP